MLICSKAGKALCPIQARCGKDEYGTFHEDTWCAGFNEGVAAAQTTANGEDPISKLDRTFNRMRKQLDYIAFAVEWQTKAIQRLLHEPEDDSGRQSQHGDDQRCDGNAQRPGR